MLTVKYARVQWLEHICLLEVLEMQQAMPLVVVVNDDLQGFISPDC